MLSDGDIVTIRAAGAAVTDRDGAPVEREEGEVTWDADAAEKGGFETFMIKEIHEQPQALADTLAGRLREDGEVDLSEVDLPVELLRRIRRVLIIACGTSFHAGLIASYAMEVLTGLPVQVDLASEFRYRCPVLDDEVLVIGITQSGETLDTLAAMRLAREAGAPVLALTNIMGSQATREADAVLFTRAGLEIGVAATKTHVVQIAALLLLTLHIARVRGTLSDDELQQVASSSPRCPPWSRTAWWPIRRSRRSRGATPASRSSCTSGATSATACASRARSSSRRSPTSRPNRTPPAR